MNLNDLRLYPWILPFVKRLVQGPTGFCVGGVKTEDPVSSAPYRSRRSSANVNDIFNIIVPFAGEVLRMQILFDGVNSGSAPDIMLPEYEDFDPDYDDVEALVRWNKDNDDSLLTAIQEFMSLYKRHHVKKCLELDQMFAKELQELLNSERYRTVEVCMKRPDKNGPRKIVNVLIRLDVDTTILDEQLFQDGPPRDPFIHSPLLLVKNDFDADKVIPLLYLPPRIEYVLGGRGVLSPPPHSSSLGLLSYADKMKEKLDEALKLVSESHGKRCQYIAAFMRQFPGHTLEYDAKSFYKISFIFSHHTFFFFVHINLTRFFPRDQPTITFQSAYHLNRRNQLYQTVYSEYPYSPRWTGAEMAKRARAFVLDRVTVFKESCIKQGVLL